ncbi:MAG: site-specific DNA-methyltransferase [Planctomycetia bacterium]|nr:MAG: site-specific DNA-methyltransferase [Planctomycetia bacterium]
MPGASGWIATAPWRLAAADNRTLLPGGFPLQRLSEQEKQEIIRFLEQNKPLPEKYRFLLFDDKREVELVWNGKTSEVCNVVLPFQTIEQVDEPRIESSATSRDCKGAVDHEIQGTLFDTRGRQLSGWTNKLIWGDNKLILSSLKNGPLRDEIEKQGGLKLIYIDPPFDVGADFSMDIEVGDGGDTFTKRPNILEEIAYRDTWGKGADSFIAMIYERLILMRDLLAEDGSIYVHMGRNVSHLVRGICDEVLGVSNFINEITWKRAHAHGDTGQGAVHYGRVTESVMFYTRSDKPIWNAQYTAYSDEILARDYKHTDAKTGEKYRFMPVDGPGGVAKGNPFYEFLGVKGAWRYSKERMQELYDAGEIVLSSTGKSLSRKRFLRDAKGTPVIDLWDDVNRISPTSAERLGYDTQKPEALLDRIIKASSNPGDLVADFFVGSGTTAAVAEKLGRKWIATDLGKFAIHTTRKRMIGVQRQLKADGKDYRAFELLNLGRYERQHYVGVNPNLREAEKQKQLEAKEAAFLELILKAYRAEKVEGFPAFHGKKAGRLVAVGPVNLPVTRLFVEEIIVECRKKNITKCDILGFEFEMGLFPNVLDEARAKGIDIAPKYIPAEVFDKRAVEKGQVVFHDVAFIEVKPIVTPGTKSSGPTVAVQLTDFSVFYNQDSIKAAEEALGGAKKAGSRIVVEKGQIVKVSKDAKGVVKREVLTEKWSDWVDYWAVDFDYESKREIIRVPPEEGEGADWVEKWTGEYIFENEWQSFRTRKERALELTSAAKEVEPGRRKIAVKVVDIFGNDTMTIVEVNIPRNGHKNGGKK